MKKDYTKEFVDYLRNGEWIEKLTPEENKLLANFLKTSMAKQRKKVALVHEVSDGVVYAIYKLKYIRQSDVLEISLPGELVVHKSGDPFPREVMSIPKLAFETLYTLGEIHES